MNPFSGLLKLSEIKKQPVATNDTATELQQQNKVNTGNLTSREPEKRMSIFNSRNTTKKSNFMDQSKDERRDTTGVDDLEL